MSDKMLEQSPSIASAEQIQAAWAAADSASVASGVSIILCSTTAQSHAVSRVLAEIWPLANGLSQLEANLVRALEYSGNYVSLAITHDKERSAPVNYGDRVVDGVARDDTTRNGAIEGHIVGACVGFFAPPADRHLHSHIAGISSAMTGRGVGRAIKLHQRAWALERNVMEISWTFDPLVARNAYFNLERLGAQVTDYLPNFYGPMLDLRNNGKASDRLVATWRLLDQQVVSLSNGERRSFDSSKYLAGGAKEWITIVGNKPVVAEAHAASGSAARLSILRIPSDFERIRKSYPGLVGLWHAAVREAFARSIGSGRWRIIGFEKHTGYLLEAVS